jgi:mRNA-degrading endonuclease RelE of RelBE toxin-antitoxin system
MKLIILKSAIQGLRGMQPKLRQALQEKLAAVAADPFGFHPSAEPMQGAKDTFRMRQGGWRAVYEVDRQAGEVRVLRVSPRGGVYKR